MEQSLLPSDTANNVHPIEEREPHIDELEQLRAQLFPDQFDAFCAIATKLLSESPSGEAGADSPKSRLGVYFEIAQRITDPKSDEEKEFFQKEERVKILLEKVRSHIIAEGVSAPEFVATYCAKMPHGAFQRASVVDAIGAQLPAHDQPITSLQEALSVGLSARAHFYATYFDALDRDGLQIKDRGRDGFSGVPIEVNMQQKLYETNGSCLVLALEQVHDFSDAVEAQRAIIRDATFQMGRTSLPSAWDRFRSSNQRGCLKQEVFQERLMSKPEEAFKLLDIGMVDQPFPDAVLSLLRQKDTAQKLFSVRHNLFAELSVRRHDGELQEEVAKEFIALGRANEGMEALPLFSGPARTYLLNAILATERGASTIANQIRNMRGEWDHIVPRPIYEALARLGFADRLISGRTALEGDSGNESIDRIARASMETPIGRKGIANAVTVWPSGKDSYKLSAESAEQLISDGHLPRVLLRPDIFEGLDQSALCRRALQKDLDEGGYKKDLGLLMGHTTYARTIAESLDVYQDLAPDIAKRLLQDTDPAVAESALLYISRFSDLDHNSVIADIFARYKKDGFIPALLPVVLGRKQTFSRLDKVALSRLVEMGIPIRNFVPKAFLPDVQTILAEKMLFEYKGSSLLLLQEWFQDLDNGVVGEGVLRAACEEVGIAFICANRRVFQAIPEDIEKRLKTHESISQKLTESPSRTVRRMKDVLIDRLADSDDPDKGYDQIAQLFLRNHIPLAAKAFLTSEIIYGQDHYKKSYSPMLRAATPREARMLLYRDIINIHIDTGNPSMREYLLRIREVAPALEALERGERLTDEQRATAEVFFRKANVLAVTTHRSSQENEAADATEAFRSWKQVFGVREGQTFQDRLAEMFLRPAGITSVDEALARMDETKRRADTENRALAAKSGNGLTLERNDLLKGVKSEYFLSYLQNGNVCKELLGYAAYSDATPLDTDVSRVDSPEPTKRVRYVLEGLDAGGYGDIALLLRPTAERYIRTSLNKEDQPTSSDIREQAFGRLNKYELFASEALSSTHENIRTGIPFTETRAIILKSPERRTLLDLKMDIVANGYFIMITDGDGKPLFTPEEFDTLRELFAGTEASPEQNVQVDRSFTNEKHDEAIGVLEGQIVAEQESMKRLKAVIEDRLKQTLQQAGISLRTSGELATGAEVMNTGSTSRRTSIPGERVDFDMVIRLDESDLERQSMIKESLDAAFSGKNQSGAVAQWRRTDVSIEGTLVDIDITFTSKPEVEGIPSNAMAEQRLASIERQRPEDAAWVRANIVYAKQQLKQAGIYKKLDGGLGGLGVENWILQSGGSFMKAREKFLEAALDERGDIRPFEECAKRYSIPDPGVNLVERQKLDSGEEKIHFRHDNFLYFLQRDGSDGYRTFVEALRSM